jgi:hypothetical protein
MMPGGRSKSYRFGDRAELLVQHPLSGLAFTTPVPRQEDVGIDFFCSLITDHSSKKLLKAGPFFTAQAKSSRKPIEYKRPHQIEWIRNQENPLLVCVADLKSGSMDVYSTWNLLCAVKNGWKGDGTVPKCIRLCPGVSHSWKWYGVEDKDDGSQDVLLGKPIISITHDQLFDDASLRLISQTIGAWIALDRENIVHCGRKVVAAAGEMPTAILSYESGLRAD